LQAAEVEAEKTADLLANGGRVTGSGYLADGCGRPLNRAASRRPEMTEAV
jgi:hypothetical protein